MEKQVHLIEFLKQELSVPAEAIALGLRQSASTPNLLPIVLWQYGLVTTYQLNEIFDWSEDNLTDF